MITVDAKELMKLNEGFRKYQNAIPKSVARKAIREAARPMLMSAQRLVPVGSVRSANGWGKSTGPQYARGGVIKKNLRIDFRREQGSEIARIFIGASGRGSVVGWRTHFITAGWTDPGGHKHRGRNFLQDAYDYTFDIVQDKFYKSIFDGLVKWGKENLPQ